MNDKDRITAQKAIIAEMQKEIAELEAAKRKILKNIPPEEQAAFEKRVARMPG